ncbi:MAG: B12-binding domain-containing radical SAM protein [Anaerolineales bacterium]|nr:B12-binding domain-containing radical SAM protein [Anaerolineales bacterium]
MKRKLILVNPVNPARTGLSFNRSSRFPPLGLGILAALTPADWDVRLVDENWETFPGPDAFFSAEEAPKLVGITAFTASANRAYEISADFRTRGIPVVMGGIHASMCTEEALRFVDSVVIGEAETVWPHVIADAEAGRLQRIYLGGQGNPAGMPRPRRDLFHPGYLFASVQTSRGCPMDCEFCSVTAFNGRRYRRRPPEDVLEELAEIPQRMLFFVDDNIVGYGEKSRAQALAVFQGMVKRRMNKWWFCQASLNFADDEEILHWAGRAGCKMVFLGLESDEADALAEVNKILNLQRGVGSYEAAFRRIHRAGIAVLGAFIFGMDEDTPEKLRRRTEFMLGGGIDVMQKTYLTPLPGTRLFDRLGREGRLLFTDYPRDWEHYDMGEAVHRPRSMNPAELTCAMEESSRRLFSWPALARKAYGTLRETRSPMAALFAWQSNVNYRNVSLAP